MRLSEKIMQGKKDTTVCVSGIIVNSADRRVAANGIHGIGQLAIVSPGCMRYIPLPQEEAVILSNDREQLCLGVKMLYNDYEIQPGEVMLFSQGGASITLKNDGSIHLEGDVYINGNRWEGT